MPKRLDIKTILVLGAGPIVIGQGCEFDYSGVQACRALKEEGYRIILVNSNPATIMTDPNFSDVTYIEPIHWQEIEKIIELERPDALLPTMGGQTALNCAMDLVRRGILTRYDVELIGANAQAIEKAEDRERFRLAMKEIHLDVPESATAANMEMAYQIQASLGFPVVIRPSFTLGGKGGGIAHNMQEFETICRQGLTLSPIHTVLIEESLLGWKEFELEVVRDNKDNCIIVCSIENIDPMGVHTGDSMTVAPALTLRDKEYQLMRDGAIKILRKIGVDTGGSNVQFAVHPDTGRMVVIEMNPRVSRSSALASKATGFPIAKVAAKLAVGFTLDELKNDITGGCIPASFEPTIDYVVTKIPRFHFDKFPGADQRLTTQMKSVGEVMALGRTFQESFQKALCGLEIGLNGLSPKINVGMEQTEAIKLLESKLAVFSFDRMLYVADAFRYGMPLERINILTGIDTWFLDQIRDLIATETEIQASTIENVSIQKLFDFKQKGFSDNRLAELWKVTEQDVRNARHRFQIRPVFKRVDSCAAEFPASSAYLYATYETNCEANPSAAKKIIVLGGGPNRIGQGIEFDYCCVHAVMALREAGFEVIMINCNPETVSTDCDISDRLYFESLNLETVLEIVHLENPIGVVVQYGGQTPLKLVKALEKAGVKILGTQADAIDCAEDRQRFQALITQLGLKQAKCETACSIEEARKYATELGYPIVVRPSYVLGGQAMRIVENMDDLNSYFQKAAKVLHDCPVLLDKFIEDAIEVDVDAVSDGKEVFIGGILEHIEPAGIHSGDSTCSLPCHSLSSDIQAKIREQVTRLALALKVVGPLNTQFAIQKNDIYVIEVNPRVSRTMPFVSKAIGLPLAKIAALCMSGKTLREQGVIEHPMPRFFSVKSPVFVFDRFMGVDTTLGPEMKSTGEVMGVGITFEEALLKSQKAAGLLEDDMLSSPEVRSLQVLYREKRVLTCVD